MDSLVQALLVWIAVNSHYSTHNIAPPKIVLMSANEITREFYGERKDLLPASGVDPRIWALYDHTGSNNGTIYVRPPIPDSSDAEWKDTAPETDVDLDDPIFQERLLHELIHHVQYKSGAIEDFLCPESAEKDAYLLGGVFFKNRYVDDPMPNRNFWAHVYSRC